MPFQLVRCTARVMLMVLAWSKFGFREGARQAAAGSWPGIRCWWCWC